MNLKRPLLVLAVTAVLAGTAAACGDDDDAAGDTTDVVTTGPGVDTTEPGVDTTEPGVDTTEPASPTDEETTVPGSSDPATSEPSTSAPGDCPEEPTEETADELLVGLTEDEATEAAEACGWILRVVRRDGEDLPATLDFRPNRVNVEVTDGDVTAIVNTG